MTYAELEGAVKDLGFETDVESRSALVSATNRALSQIARSYAPTGTLCVTQSVPCALYPSARTVGAGGYAFSCSGARAVSFLTCGTGRFEILFEGEAVARESTSSAVWRMRQFLAPRRGTLTVTFWGSEDREELTVKSLAFFESVSVAGEGAVPSFEKNALIYTLPTKQSDLLYGVQTPVDEAGDSIPGAYFSADHRILFVPVDYRGEISFLYRRRYRQARLEDFALGTGEVDIYETVADLLPLLVASYIWLDDDPVKAEHYKALYDEELRRQRFSLTPRFAHTASRRGWR